MAKWKNSGKGKRVVMKEYRTGTIANKPIAITEDSSAV